MKKLLFVALFAVSCMAANAKRVDITIHTSCGIDYHIGEIGNNVTSKQLAAFVRHIDETFCG